MQESTLYTAGQMALIYAGLVSVSIVTMSGVFLSVFMLDEYEFVCHTTNETLQATCPENKVSNCVFVWYNRSVWTNSLITEMDLVCDRAWMKAMPYYGWFVGMALTTFTMPLSDMCGRWTVIFAGQAALTVTLLLSAASTSIYVYRLALDF